MISYHITPMHMMEYIHMEQLISKQMMTNTFVNKINSMLTSIENLYSQSSNPCMISMTNVLRMCSVNPHCHGDFISRINKARVSLFHTCPPLRRYGAPPARDASAVTFPTRSRFPHDAVKFPSLA